MSRQGHPTSDLVFLFFLNKYIYVQMPLAEFTYTYDGTRTQGES